jgi:hypothetical protein
MLYNSQKNILHRHCMRFFGIYPLKHRQMFTLLSVNYSVSTLPEACLMSYKDSQASIKSDQKWHSIDVPLKISRWIFYVII